MVDILHAVGIKAPSHAVYNAVVTQQGLSSWWTETTDGDSDAVGGVIEFRFGDRGFIKMKVVELQPDRRVVWEVIGGPQAWIGTKVIWDLRHDADTTTIFFKHQGWNEPGEFMHHCSTKWGTFLVGLKALLETGEGRPWPHDVHIGTKGD